MTALPMARSEAWTKYDMIFLGLEDGLCAPGAR
jgi:hypothetical protein